MAISPFINFAALPVRGDPTASSFVQNLMQGYQFGQQARAQKQQREAQDMRNQMLSQSLAYMPFEQGMNEEKQSLANQLTRAQLAKTFSDMDISKRKADLEQQKYYSDQLALPSKNRQEAMESLKKQPASVQYTYLTNPEWLQQQGYSPEEAELIGVNARYSNLTSAQQERISKARAARELYDDAMRKRFMDATAIQKKPFYIGRGPWIGDEKEIRDYNVVLHQDIPFLSNAIRNLEGIPGTHDTIQEFEKIFSSAMSARTVDRRKALMAEALKKADKVLAIAEKYDPELARTRIRAKYRGGSEEKPTPSYESSEVKVVEKLPYGARITPLRGGS